MWVLTGDINGYCLFLGELNRFLQVFFSSEFSRILACRNSNFSFLLFLTILFLPTGFFPFIDTATLL